MLRCLFLLVALLSISKQVHCSLWTASSKYTGSYSQILFPVAFTDQLPIAGNYYVFQELAGTPYEDICVAWRTFANASLDSCIPFFCTLDTNFDTDFTRFNKHKDFTHFNNFMNVNNFTSFTSFTNPNITMQRVIRNMTNFCTYCEHESSSSFKRLVDNGKCPRFRPLNTSQCGNGKSIFFGKLAEMGRVDMDQLLCYCPGPRRYGYRCDAFTAFFIPFYSFGKNWLITVFLVPMLLLILFILVIPECYYRWERFIASRKIAVSTMKRLLALRVQIVVFLFLAFLLLLIEQVWGVMLNFYVMEEIRKQVIGGSFRMFSFVPFFFSYVGLLILWINIYEKKPQQIGLTRKNKFILVFTYVSITLFIIIVLSMNKIVPSYIIYSIFSTGALAFFLTFFLFYIFYGIRMLIILRRAEQLREQRRRFLIFWIIFLFSIIIILIIASLMLTGYLKGWDFMGVFMGLFRNTFTDGGMLLLGICIMYICFQRAYHFRPYKKLLGYLKPKGNETVDAQLFPQSSSVFYVAMDEEQEQQQQQQNSTTEH